LSWLHPSLHSLPSKLLFPSPWFYTWNPLDATLNCAIFNQIHRNLSSASGHLDFHSCSTTVRWLHQTLPSAANAALGHRKGLLAEGLHTQEQAETIQEQTTACWASLWRKFNEPPLLPLFLLHSAPLMIRSLHRWERQSVIASIALKCNLSNLQKNKSMKSQQDSCILHLITALITTNPSADSTPFASTTSTPARRYRARPLPRPQNFLSNA
jgi:hypothetical protein